MTFIQKTNIQAADSPSIDAFGRWRVSQTTTQIEQKYIINKLPLLIDEVTIGNASSTLNSPEVDMTTTTSGDAIIRQTKIRGLYLSGKSPEIYMTFRNFETVVNGEKRIGYFSSSVTSPYNTAYDGILLRSDGTTIYAETYSSGTITSSIARVNWYDPLDGTGRSGINHDFDKNTIINIDFEWLGYGRVRYYLINAGVKVLFNDVHFTNGSYVLTSNNTYSILNSNFIGTYMSSSNQPLRWELRQTGVGSNIFTNTCSTFGSEGSLNTIGRTYSVSNSNTPVTLNSQNVPYAVLGFRKNNNNGLINYSNLSLISRSNDDVYFRLALNPTITLNGGTFNYNPLPNTVIDFAVGDGTVRATGGFTLYDGYVTANSDLSVTYDSIVKIGQQINGTFDYMVLIVTPLSNGASVLSSLTVNEDS